MTKKTEKIIDKLENELKEYLQLYKNNSKADYTMLTKKTRNRAKDFEEMLNLMLGFDLISIKDFYGAASIARELSEKYCDNLYRIKKSRSAE